MWTLYRVARYSQSLVQPSDGVEYQKQPLVIDGERRDLLENPFQLDSLEARTTNFKCGSQCLFKCLISEPYVVAMPSRMYADECS